METTSVFNKTLGHMCVERLVSTGTQSERQHEGTVVGVNGKSTSIKNLSGNSIQVNCLVGQPCNITLLMKIIDINTDDKMGPDSSVGRALGF